jgi:hypothetical protein
VQSECLTIIDIERYDDALDEKLAQAFFDIMLRSRTPTDHDFD